MRAHTLWGVVKALKMEAALGRHQLLQLCVRACSVAGVQAVGGLAHAVDVLYLLHSGVPAGVGERLGRHTERLRPRLLDNWA